MARAKKDAVAKWQVNIDMSTDDVLSSALRSFLDDNPDLTQTIDARDGDCVLDVLRDLNLHNLPS